MIKVPIESGTQQLNEIFNTTDRNELNADEENQIIDDRISKRGANYNEAKYGNAALLVGREFNFKKQQGNYKFTDVVVNKDNRKEFFKNIIALMNLEIQQPFRMIVGSIYPQ